MFRKAERKQAKLRLAICGPSGSGKTYSALLVAQGLANGGKIALLDTERGSGELYSSLSDYDVAPIDPPYTPARYIEVIKGAAQAGYSVLIIDSLSHAWEGEGGVLEMHDRAASASRSGNTYTAWREVTPQHNALVNAILNSPLHVIANMRTKVAYEMSGDGKGKNTIKKLGLAPVQRAGMDYEFTTVLDLSVDSHVATASKDRTSLFDGQHFVPTVETGQRLREWLDSGKAERPQPTAKETDAYMDADEPDSQELTDICAAFREAATKAELDAVAVSAAKLKTAAEKSKARGVYTDNLHRVKSAAKLARESAKHPEKPQTNMTAASVDATKAAKQPDKEWLAGYDNPDGRKPGAPGALE